MQYPSKGLRPSLAFAPFIADNPDGTQTLVEIFVNMDEDNSFTFDSVWICHRSDASDQWSVPQRLTRP
jgi:hypothetical protein